MTTRRPSAMGIRLTDLFRDKRIGAPSGETESTEVSQLRRQVDTLVAETARQEQERQALAAEVTDLREALAQQPQKAFDQAVAALKSGDSLEAAGLFQVVTHLSTDPDDSLSIKARINLAVAWARLGFPDRAVAVLKAVLAAEPENPTAAANLAFLEDRSGESG